MLTITTTGEKNRVVVVGSPAIDFSLSYYPKLCNHPMFLVNPLERVFAAMAEDMQDEIYDLYHDSKLMIDLVGTRHPDTAVNFIRDRMSFLVNHIGLDDVLVDLVHKGGFSIPSFAEAGTREHHDERRTFYKEDYIELTAICLLTKLLIPIWGSLVEALSNIQDPEARSKEDYLYDTLFATVSDGQFGRVFEKMEFFTKGIITTVCQKFDKKVDLGEETSKDILENAGMTHDDFENRVMAILLTKKFPSFTITEQSANLVIYMHDSVTKIAETTLKALRSAAR